MWNCPEWPKTCYAVHSKEYPLFHRWAELNEEKGIALLLQLEILYEVLQNMKELSVLNQSACARLLGHGAREINKCQYKIRLTHQYYLILGKFAERMPDVIAATGLSLELPPSLAIPALRTPEEREAFLAALYAIQNANNHILGLSDLQTFFEPQPRGTDRFFAGQMERGASHFNLGNYVLDRQQTGRIAHLDSRRVKREAIRKKS